MPVVKDSSKIRRMFADISGRYDFLNHFLSLGIDRLWRRAAVRTLELEPDDRVLDACTGTADLALEIASALDESAGGLVVGTDFCPEMVTLGEEKRERRSATNVELLVADTLSLPFPDGHFDAVTVAFGIRNVCDLAAGLRELRRVTKPGGRTLILEFTTPRHRVVRRAFGMYFHGVLPFIGRVLSRHPTGGEAYSYLPESVAEFPRPQEFSELLADSGFERVTHRPLSQGIACLHLAHVPAT